MRQAHYNLWTLLLRRKIGPRPDLPSNLPLIVSFNRLTAAELPMHEYFGLASNLKVSSKRINDPGKALSRPHKNE